MNCAPLRVSRTQRGAAPETPVLALTPDTAVRRTNATPLDGVTSTEACIDRGSSVWRIMMPALVHAFTFCTELTRATIEPSPGSGTYAYRNASAVPQMSAPALLTVKTPLASTALPV